MGFSGQDRTNKSGLINTNAMNQQQRKYLIDKIKAQHKAISDAHQRLKPEPPDLMNHIYAAVLGDTFKIRSTDAIALSIKKRALANKTANNFLNPRAWRSTEAIELPIDDLFELPETYIAAKREYDDLFEKWMSEGQDLAIEVDTLEARIMLASDARLRAIIDEIDDMGDLKLIDSKLRGMDAPQQPKKLK